MWRPLVPAGIVILLMAAGLVIAGQAANKAIAPRFTINKQRLAHRVALAEQGLCKHHRPACELGLAKVQLQRRNGDHEPTVNEIEAAADRAAANLTTQSHSVAFPRK